MRSAVVLRALTAGLATLGASCLSACGPSGGCWVDASTVSPTVSAIAPTSGLNSCRADPVRVTLSNGQRLFVIRGSTEYDPPRACLEPLGIRVGTAIPGRAEYYGGGSCGGSLFRPSIDLSLCDSLCDGAPDGGAPDGGSTDASASDVSAGD